MSVIAEAVERDGYCLVREVIAAARVDALVAALSEIDGAAVRRRGEMYAIRNVFDTSPAVCALAQSPEIRALAAAVLGEECFAIQAVLLDKIPGANWKVPFHQDLYVPLARRVDAAEAAGYSGWSDKAGVDHAKPPVAVLESVLTLRIHLDDCDESQGPLRVLPGSHRSGELDAGAIRRRVEEARSVACVAPRGSVLLLRPLLLHASSPAENPGHRRVLQLQYTNYELPENLAWHARI